MDLRGVVKLAAKAAMAVGAIFAVSVLLAAMPGRRAPAAQQPDSSAQSSQQQEEAGKPHDMPGVDRSAVTHDVDRSAVTHDMDMSDEKASEAHAVQDMRDMAAGHNHMPGPHLRMTEPRPQTSADVERAEHVIRELREGIDKYKEYRVALADGYRIFLPNLPQKEYHFTNYKNGFLEAFTFDPARPTSLLYKKTTDGFELVGAMYTMPKNASEDQLNARLPLSVASWHPHTNLCMPPRGQMRAADWTQFGLQGSIATQEACDAAGGRFHPVIFGWMVHVYPYRQDIAAAFAH